MAAAPTVFGDASLAQVKEAIEILYSPVSGGSDKTAAQLWIQNLQKQPAAWGIASQLLRSETPTFRFFGALTFQLKLATEWHTLSAEQIMQVRDELLVCLLESARFPQYVVTKLCISLVLIALRDENDQWPDFVVFFCQTVDAKTQSAASDDERIALQMLALEFMIVVPEEVSKAELTVARRARVTEYLNNATPLALERINSVLDTQALAGVGALTNMKAKALKCMQSWVQYGVPLNDLGPMIHKVMDLLPQPDLFDHAMDALIDLIGCSNVKAYAASLSDELLKFITSGWLREALMRAVNDGDEPCARSICRLLIEFGDNFYPALTSGLANPAFLEFLAMLLALTGYEGYYPADQEISELPFAFWATLQETLEEDGVFDQPGTEEPDFYTDATTGRPVFKDGGMTLDDDGRISITNIAPAKKQNRDQATALSSVAKDIYSKLVQTLLIKTTFPEQSEWNGWPQDIKDRFTNFRSDSADLLLTCFYVLRNQMLEYLVPLAIRQVDEVQTQLIPWQTLESTVHAIKAITDSVETNEAIFLPQLFGQRFLVKMLNEMATMPARLHFTTALLIGSYGEWFAHHSAHLLVALQYLIASVQVPKLAPRAIDGLLTLCDLCRSNLVTEADTLVALWTQVGASLQPLRKSRLVKAIANVIQEMPNELMLPRLWTLLNGIIGDIMLALDGFAQNPVERKEQIVSQLMSLKSCCAGLQSTDLTDSSKPSGEILDAEQEAAAGVIFDMASRCCAMFASDMDVIEVLCGFMSQAISSNIPIFTPKLSAVVSLIVDTYSRNPLAYLLDLAATVGASYGARGRFLSAQERGEITRLLLGVSVVTIKLFEQQDMQTYTDIVHSYFDFLRRCINLCPWALIALPQEVIDGIFSNLALKGFGMQERMALGTLLDFFITVINQDYDESELMQLVQYIVNRIGQQLVFLLIQAIGGQQPRSMDDKLADTLFKLNMRYPDLTRAALFTCLAQPDFPSSRVSAAEKEAFIKSAAGLRHLKRFRDAVKKFGLLCRGLANTAF
ncbi:armadillo-type protein [Geranomyces variabilis]|nr:armadillo-type protein [Geranomyces variabilis]KAJ3133465.1 hypothetical protein HDU90_005784 [Geranomyces variabilis]